jgi:hypothetical protein
MRDWSLTAEDPLVLTLAADVRFGTPDYADDQIWELVLSGGDPPAMALQTSYGRRARGMRLFPFVNLAGRRQTDPARFAEPPRVRRFLPNYLKIESRPFPALALTTEAWVPESHALAGRLALTNLSGEPVSARLGLHVQLSPLEGGRPAEAANVRGVTVLAGRAGNLVPVVFFSGGAAIEAAPVPGLAINLTLDPGARRVIPWVHAGCTTVDDSFDLARAVAARPWDAELARLEIADAAVLEFDTGDPQWDALLALSQHAGLRSFLGPSRYLRHPSFVASRQPDQGYSARGDGRDHPSAWSGQDAGRAGAVIGLVAYAAPGLAEGVLRNFISVQSPDGSIDGRPGLAGQRSGSLCIPCLAGWVYAWCVRTQDWALAREAFPRLLEFYRDWFTPAHDRDQDGFPEWDTALHALLEDGPSFARWQPWSQGLDIQAAETVDLACYLIRETEALLAMADVVDREDLRPELEEHRRRLVSAVQGSWSEATASYHAVDRDSHRTPAGGRIAVLRGAQRLTLDRAFEPSARLIVHCRCEEARGRGLRLTARGRTAERPAHERMSASDFRWFFQHGTATSERTFAEVDSMEAEGIDLSTEIEVLAADYGRGEVTQLLPLWAGIPDARRAQAMVERTLLDPARYRRRYGLPIIPADDPAYRPDRRDGCGGTWMPWTAMILQGLVRYGYRRHASELFTRVMDGLVACVREEKAFFESYNADAPQGLGDRHDLAGAAPVEALLDILGLRLVSPTRLRLEGALPFDRPITVRWHGLEVRREPKRTLITFPDGQQIELDGDEPRWIEQGP